MKKLIQQIMRFGVVGGICFLIDYGVMVALVELAGFNEILASGCSFCVSVVINYILSITIVFETDKNANRGKQFVTFVILSLIGLGINEVIMAVGTGILNAYISRSYLLVKIFATGIVMVYNFITRKIFLEKH